MPPRINTVNTAGTGASNWYTDLPPITKFYGTGVFLVTFGVTLKFLSPATLILRWPAIYKQFQIWRLFTNFFFIGKFSFPSLIKMVWIFTYGVTLERSTYQFDPAGYLFLYIFSGAVLLTLSLLLPALGVTLYMCSDPMILVLVYVWSRNFPDEKVSILGLFKIQSFYLPFAFMAITLMMGGDIIADILGILTGHLYWFLIELYPRTSGITVLKTPVFLRNWLSDMGVGAPIPRDDGAPSGFQAFRGRGRRLGAD